MRVSLSGGGLMVELGSELRCLSSAVLGGGLGRVRTWFNLEVPSGYCRTDPEAHLRAVTAGMAGPVVGMLTAAPVARYQDIATATARAIATVGLSHPVAAAGERVARDVRVGTINVLAVSSAPLTGAGLVGALQTALEAKVQALSAAGVRAMNSPGMATGTPTDSIAIACPLGESEDFAGPATNVGADIAAAVYEAIRRGCDDWSRHGR